MSPWTPEVTVTYSITGSCTRVSSFFLDGFHTVSSVNEIHFNKIICLFDFAKSKKFKL